MQVYENQSLYHFLSLAWIMNIGMSVTQEGQRYTYRVLQTIQIQIILLCVWAERAVLGSAKTSWKFKHEI